MTKGELLALLTSFLAGISTIIGFFLIFFIKKKNKEKIIAKSLAFAAGVMICVSFTDLILSAYNLMLKGESSHIKLLIVVIYVVIGIIISMEIDKLLPNSDSNKNNYSIYRVGIISMIAIIIHNIPEGIATFVTSSNDLKLGITLSIAIALHNIPEGISISMPIYYASNNAKKAFLYTLFSGMSELVGAFLAFLILKPFITNNVMAAINALIAGIMIHIAVYELIPSSYKYSSLKVVFRYFLIGVVIMLISHIFI